MRPRLVELRAEPTEAKPELGFRTFSELAALPPEPDWLWDGVLARGALTMLAGHPYVGKSMLVNGLVKALEASSEFLGRPTTRATALLVTEEHDATLRPRVEQLRLHELQSEFISRSNGVFRIDWPALVDRATDRALARGHALLVVDTFSGLARLESEEENDAAAITRRLHPLTVAAGEGLAVLFLHHLNKNGQPRGSTAFRGVTDTAIRMYRDKGRNDFRLHIESRFPSAASLKGMLIESARGLSYGSKRRIAPVGNGPEGGSTEERLLEALRHAGPAGLTYDEIGSLPGLSVDMAKKTLGRLIGTTVFRTGLGRKGDPYRWHASAIA